MASNLNLSDVGIVEAMIMAARYFHSLCKKADVVIVATGSEPR